MRLSILLLGLLSLTGCKASLSANASVGDEQPSRSDPPPPPSVEATNNQSARTAFVGVTHALSLTDEASATATCTCMAAAVGLPGASTFQWRGTPPTVGEDALVVAISNEKTPCPTQGFRGPSIQGIEPSGSDIVVYLEEPRPGIPVAHGAVFQRPIGEGSLIFRSARRLPYGHPLAGSGAAVCKIPLGAGPARSPSEATPSRRGVNAPVNTF